ncbi:AraC family transcriptional regulator [Escherichia coli]|uniref:AraC family transcriptional regulator n=1 Tax=Escherichia coli TaxID=562 RepID=UPI000A188AC4|nr:AraC family transcriptional regulator [Escherichia coli]OSL96421.1 transcriptional activator AarP [Escherichia coli T426]
MAMTAHVLFTEEIVAYIERNIRRNIRLAEVGDRSGYSVRQLQRIFQRVVGMPVTTTGERVVLCKSVH